MVLLAEAAGGSILLTGDMEFAEENDLLEAGVVPRCTVIKIANHGESDATSEALINTVRPDYAIISTNSDDEHDTPSKRVLKLLKKASIQTALTQNGEAGVMTVIRNGAASVSFVSWGELPAIVDTVRLSKENETFTTTVTNTGSEAVDLSGWSVLSERGG